MYPGEATDQGFAIAGFKFMKFTSVNKAGYDFMYLVWVAGIARDDPVHFLGGGRPD